MFLMSSLHILPLMVATMLAAGAMLLFRCCQTNGVTKYIEWDLLLILGTTVIFSTAITKTGIDHAIADGFLSLWGGNMPNPYVIMAITGILASLVSEFFSDVGVAGLFFGFSHPHACLRPWRLPVYRLHEGWLLDEYHPAGCQHPDCLSAISY